MSLAIATGTVNSTAAIEAAIAAVWVAEGLDDDHIFYTDTVNQPPANVKWLRVTVEFGSNSPAGFGGGGIQSGLIQLQFFGPGNKGGGDLHALADAFKAALTRQTAGDVRFYNQFTGDGPRGPSKTNSGAWAGRRLDVPFHYWEVL